MIAELLLDNLTFNIKEELSPLQFEAASYHANSKWVWVKTQGALEWLFYAKQK